MTPQLSFLRVRGSTLIEVLIAILVACVGLLAMARLSAGAIGHQKSAQLRLTGLSLAQEYAERARLNVYGYDLGAYTITLGNTSSPREQVDTDADDRTAAQGVAQDDRAHSQFTRPRRLAALARHHADRSRHPGG